MLGRVQLAHAIGSLDDPIAEEGANLSSGQRQLLCIARALLMRPALVIMDEATSSVDLETDAFVQRVIRAEFMHTTVITIAHRLNAILDADKILVLDAGHAIEFGPPKVLMANHQSAFREMVGATSNLG